MTTTARDPGGPGQTYTFRIVRVARAPGDFRVPFPLGRRALRVHLGDVAYGLKRLEPAVRKALA
jgi:hypothetical protein